MSRRRAVIDLAEVERLAATGASQDAIARVLGVSPGTLYSRKRESAEFKEAVERGRAQAEAAYADALKEIALAKRPDGTYVYSEKVRFQAIKFFLERRPGWRMTDGQAEDGVQAVPTIKVKIEQSRTASASVAVEPDAGEAEA